MNSLIIFTGGGSGGHVMPAITMIKYLPQGVSSIYIGGSGIEKELIPHITKFFEISTGKLRRYFSKANGLDFFKFIKGIFDAFFILRKYKKQNPIIFSTGGYVALPVVISGYILGIKIVIHEQTSRAGLANTISGHFAKTILVSFEESIKYFPKRKTFFTGYPLREEIFDTKVNLITLNGITVNNTTKKIILITGGGNGSKLINDLVVKFRDRLSDFCILHQVGKNFIQDFPTTTPNYIPFDFSPHMIDLIKMSSLIITRSGAGITNELIALNKNAIFIPLKIAQHNEQFFNAKFAETKLNATIIKEDDLASIDLISEINKLLNKTPKNSILIDARSKILAYLKN